MRTIIILGLIVAVVAVGIKHKELKTWWKIGGVKLPVVYALSPIMPGSRCDELSAEDIINGTARGGTIKLRDIRASLLHWMENAGHNGRPLQGICARYLEQNGVCFCIVNMVRDSGEPENLVDMYNLEIIGTSPGGFVRNRERSALCKNEIETVRFLDITVRWMNEEGVIREREVKGQAAQTIQQIDVVQRGEGSCQDSSTEAAIAVLTKKVNDLRLQMLHGTPDNIAMLSAEQVQQYLRNNNNQRQLPR